MKTLKDKEILDELNYYNTKSYYNKTIIVYKCRLITNGK